MARLARVVIPALPHPVTRRGDGRARVFFRRDDHACSRDLLAESCRAAEVAVWARVPMPSHVHLVPVPAGSTQGAGAPGISGRASSARSRWMRHTRPRRRPWAGAGPACTRIRRTPGGITAIAPVLERFPDFAALLAGDCDPASLDRLRRAESIGRPLGDGGFLARPETATGRILQPAKRGPTPRAAPRTEAVG